MLARLGLAPIIEAVGRMVAGEAADLVEEVEEVEEDREGIKLSSYLFLLRTHKIYS